MVILNRLRIARGNTLEQHSRRVPPTPVIVANDELAAGGYWRFYMNLVWADAAVDVGGGVQHVCKENHNGNRSDHQMSWVEY